MEKIKGRYSLKIGERTKEEGEIECVLFHSLKEAREHMDGLLSEEERGEERRSSFRPRR